MSGVTLLTKPLKKICIKDKKIFQEVTKDLYSGWEQVYGWEMIDESKMRTSWRGAKMPFALWEQIVAFMRWSQATYKCEALISFFYHIKDGAWKAWPFPQHPVGMTVNYITDHPLYEADRRQFGKGWIQFGSLHHHCTSGAFQSGTDKADEDDRDGLHITLGKMDEMMLEIDIRQVFDQITTKGQLHNWVDFPVWSEQVPIHLKFELFSKASLTVPGDIAFPAEWKERIIPRVHGQPWEKNSRSRSGGRSGHGSDHTPSAPPIGSEWRAQCKVILKGICDSMKLSVHRAQYITGVMNHGLLDQEGQTLRTELMRRANTRHVCVIHLEGLFEEMSNEAVALAHAGAGGPDPAHTPADPVPDLAYDYDYGGG